MSRPFCGVSYTCFTGIWILGQFGETWPEYPKSCKRTHEKCSKVFSSLFHIKWDLTLVSGPSVCLGPLWVELYLFLGYSSIWAIWRNWARIPQIMCKDTWKVIQSLQLLVSYQMRPYSSVWPLCGSSYTCFTGIRVLGQFGEIGPKYPKSRARTHEK